MIATSSSVVYINTLEKYAFAQNASLVHYICNCRDIIVDMIEGYYLMIPISSFCDLVLICMLIIVLGQWPSFGVQNASNE